MNKEVRNVEWEGYEKFKKAKEIAGEFEKDFWNTKQERLGKAKNVMYLMDSKSWWERTKEFNKDPVSKEEWKEIKKTCSDLNFLDL
jgi:hypothetical protein